MSLHTPPVVPAAVARVLAARLMPAVGVSTPEDAVAVARVFLAGGLAVMEITLRNDRAPECIAAVRAQVPEMTVGAGTLLNPSQVALAIRVGAQFGVTPGFNPEVVRAANAAGFPIIPGIATAGELEQALALGCAAVKAFPVEELGGVGFLKALAGPYAQTGIRVIPMGGVSPANAAAYAAAPLVGALGGSWMAAPELIKSRDWNSMTRLTREAVALVKLPA